MASALRRAAAALLLLIMLAARASAQDRIAIAADVLVYGDNTEFRNPFREGETLFGAALRVGAEVDLSDRVRVTLGAFGHQRFGSEDAFEQARPAVAIEVRGRRSAFLLGTFPPSSAADAPGPDRAGPHGLLPPLQRETLAFERPYEAGLMWTFTGTTLRHALWIDWQRLNTPDHRERFDAGAEGAVALSGRVSLPFQLHVVHEGGQQFASGAVRDSLAAALGLALRAPTGPFDAVSLELYGLASRHVPDREAPDRTRSGAGVFGRWSAERGGWRGHVIVWRGDDFVKEEGDPNYHSIRSDGTRYRGVRDYAEAGITRTFRPVAGIRLEASARLHRVEKHYEYSYRVLAAAALRWRVR